MGMKHLLLEVYCDCILENGDEKPEHCIKGIDKPGSHCFENRCGFLSYCDTCNEISYVGKDGYVEAWDECIGFGGDMELESFNENSRSNLLNTWRNICKVKINEAYKEYMKSKDGF